MFKIVLILSLSVMGSKAFADNNDFKMVQRIIDSVSQKYAPDKRTALFDVNVTDDSGQIVMKGKTNLPKAKQEVMDSLSKLKIAYTDSVLVLPELSMGEKTWALATLSVSNIRSGPDHAAELVSQALMGTPVKVLESVDGWVHIQTPDLYIGWVDEMGISMKTEAEMTLWKHSKRCFFNQIAGRAVAAPKRNASSVSDLVLGDLFESVSEVKNYLQIKFPDGRMAYVKKTDCLPYEDWIVQKPNVDAVLSIAKQMLGNPYMWGGTSCKAVDCSGMTKIAWYTQGVILARDASQQARYGEHIDFKEIANLQKGDLLFFGRNAQHIIHVGMYLGKGLYIHASGLVRINSIDPNDPLYNMTERKHLVAATRILNSVNSEGIVGVKEQGWY
ncbi:MAG TPA: glycoside hydrolase [Prolixibacteraceae bacterium]|nr:glycoside hydrolase [Prolixibacteraceae bacterium]